MYVRFVQGEKGLIEIKHQWEVLFQNSVNPAIYNDWRWHEAIQKNLVTQDIYYFCIYENQPEDLIAIVPLVPQHRTIKNMVIDELTFPSHSAIDVSDIVLKKGAENENIFKRIIKFIKSEKLISFDSLELKDFPQRSATMKLLRNKKLQTINKTSFIKHHPEMNECYGLSKKQIKNVRRNIKNTESRYGNIKFEEVCQSTELPSAYDCFLEVEASGWKGEGGEQSAIIMRPDAQAFYLRLLETFSYTEDAAINLLTANGKPIAGQICLKCHHTLYILKIGYNEEYKDIGPGNIILLNCIQSEAQKKTHEINLMTSPEWSYRWHFDEEFRYAYSLYTHSPKSLFLRIYRKLKHEKSNRYNNLYISNKGR